MALGVIAEAQGHRWVGRSLLLAALWLMVMLLAIKVRIGWVSESLSLMAGGLLTVMASFSLLLSLLALFSPPANRHHFGHNRLEAGTVLLLVGLMGFVCCTLLGKAGQQLFEVMGNSAIAPPAPITASLFEFLVGATVVSFVAGIAGYYQAKILNHPTLKLSFRHSLLDASVMIVILGVLVGRNLGIHWLDPMLAGIVVLIAVATGWQLLNRQFPLLLQPVAIAPEALTATVRQVEGILQCRAIQSRGLVGRLVYIEMQLVLHPECMTVASTITSRVERLLHQHYGPVQVQFHLESHANNLWPMERGA